MSMMFPGGQPPTSGSGGGIQSASDLLDSVVSDLHELAGAVDDPADKQIVLKALTLVQGIHVQEQKENEAAAGTTPAHKGMANIINRLASQVHGG